MEENNEVTKVIFRKYSNGEIIALFFEEPGSNRVSECLDYVHVGQHGSANVWATVKDTKLAIPEEYKDLFEELTKNVGYNLKVCKRVSGNALDIRYSKLNQ